MAAPNDTTRRPVDAARGSAAQFSLTEFRDLVNKRDYFAYHAAACAETALTELESGDIAGAKRILASAVSLYHDADRAIDRFRREHPNVNSVA